MKSFLNIFLACFLFYLANSKCPDQCNRYSPDGCNECLCDGNGNEYNCTTGRQCLVFRPPSCLSCNSNLEWTDCGSCITTCNNIDEQNSIACSMSCREQCECPINAPIYHDGTCITKYECPSLNKTKTVITTNSPNQVGTTTYKHTTSSPNNDKCPYSYQLCASDNDCKSMNEEGVIFSCQLSACTSSSCSLNERCELEKCTKDCLSNMGWCRPGGYRSTIPGGYRSTIPGGYQNTNEHHLSSTAYVANINKIIIAIVALAMIIIF